MNSASSPGRSPKLEGIDYKQAAIDYPSRQNPEGLHYLRTKPFYHLANKPAKFRGDGMDVETHRHFCDFANMAVALGLPAGARILDAACGSGWLSEYLARLGYDVTGIDISPQLIGICEERVGALPPIDREKKIRCRFRVHDIELSALDERFDAVICYDAIHHLEDAGAALRHLATMLSPGGVLFILEGNRPAPGSAGEAELMRVMEKFGTLESAFDREHLGKLLNDAGFAIAGDYVSVNGLFDREAVDDEGRLRIEVPSINYLLCKKVVENAPASTVPDSREPGLLRAEIAMRSNSPEQFTAGQPFTVRLRIRNAGDTLWLGGPFLRRGGVTLGVKIFDEAGEVCDEFHGEPALPRALAPNESCEVTIERASPGTPGRYTLKIDLVDQHICWFEERGSTALYLPFVVS
ncbi:MAG: methyltransferase domain-containing protein [Chthoniobacterales bacterium]